MEQTFDGYLLEAMRSRDLSQSDVGRGAEVNRSRVSEWLSGRSFPSPRTLERLAHKFGLDLDLMMRLCGYRTATPLSAVGPDETEIVVLYRQVPGEQQPLIRTLLRSLAVQPVNKGPDNRRRDTQANRERRAAAKLEQQGHPQGHSDDEDPDNHVLQHGHWWRNPSRTATVERRLASVSV